MMDDSTDTAYSSSSSETLPRTRKSPVCNEHYESEIEKCIKSGIIDANIPSGPGLPPLPPLETTSKGKSASTSMESLSVQPQQTICGLPAERRPSAEVLGGLRRLAQLVQRATGQDRRIARMKFEECRRGLSIDAEKIEREAKEKTDHIQREWEQLDSRFASIGRASRIKIRDELNERSIQLTSLIGFRRSYLDGEGYSLARQWSAIGGRSLDASEFF